MNKILQLIDLQIENILLKFEIMNYKIDRILEDRGKSADSKTKR